MQSLRARYEELLSWQCCIDHFGPKGLARTGEIVMRVLLIEDDSSAAQSIERMLKYERFNVYRTDLGEEEIDLGKLYDYDIILPPAGAPAPSFRAWRAAVVAALASVNERAVVATRGSTCAALSPGTRPRMRLATAPRRTGPIAPRRGWDNAMWRFLFWLSAVLAVVFLVGGVAALFADVPDRLFTAGPFFIWVACLSLIALYSRRRLAGEDRQG
jgi:hypothetical protein